MINDLLPGMLAIVAFVAAWFIGLTIILESESK